MPTSKSVPASQQEGGQALRNNGLDPTLPSSPEDEQLTPIPASQKRALHGEPVLADEQDFDPSLDPNSYGFGNDLLEDGSLDIYGIFNRTGSGMTDAEPQSATSLTGRSLNTASRKSTGRANLSSQLMSPVATEYNFASSESIAEANSPIIKHKVLGGGPLDDLTNQLVETPSASRSSAMRGNNQSIRKRRGSEPSLQAPDEDYFVNNPEMPGIRHGLEPASRDQLKNTVVTTLKEQETNRAVAAKNLDITNWLSISPADHEHLAGENAGYRPRRRSRSTGDQIVFSPGFSHPAPLLEDDEPNDFAIYQAQTAAMSAKNPLIQSSTVLQSKASDADLKRTDASPWVDPIRMPSDDGVSSQPGTANEAMMKFLSRARDVETASRAATWGTQRRMSDGSTIQWSKQDQEMHRIFGHGGLLSRLSLSKDKEAEHLEEWHNFKEYAKEKANRWWPKRESFHRHPSNLAGEVPTSPSEHSAASPAPSIKSKRESTHDLAESIRARLHRHSSTKKPTSPELDTVHGPTTPPEGNSPSHHHSIHAFAHEIRGRLSRHSSKEDDAHHIASLWKTHSNGPPVAYPKLSQSSINKSTSSFTKQPASINILQAPTVAEPTPIEETFAHHRLPPTTPISTTSKVKPSLEGFKMEARLLLPNLPAFLVDRLALEQLRRYKKLVEFKAKHARLVATGQCPSGAHCTALAEPLVTYFPAKATKDPPMSQLSINMAGDIDEDDEALDEGLLTESSFPVGMPSTPAKRLPAQFECPLCFQVKKFTKPSDWSKHVHEDLQPFTCTWPDCSEPKSFKRKADWVRHESERHRQLEWWQCNKNGCSHKCYRRDNFVHHLVREHKMQEPKAKTVKDSTKPAVRGPAKNKGKGLLELTPETEVLWMVENCKHETDKKAVDEPCRLCGRAWHSWKKLTVDLAKHMEELSLPILALVEAREVDSDTIISPIENKPIQQFVSPFTNSSSVSPFDNPNGLATMPDLHNAFPTLNAAMPPPHFGNVSWGGNVTQPEANMFASQMSVWPSQQMSFVSQPNSAFPNSAFGQHHDSGYGHVSGPLSQDVSLSYDNSAFLDDPTVSPSYTGLQIGGLQTTPHQSPPLAVFPTNVHGNLAVNQQTTPHQSPPSLPGFPIGNPQYNNGNNGHDDSLLYSGQADDSMHLQHGSYNPVQQQFYTRT